jgi:hypothetical protein
VELPKNLVGMGEKVKELAGRGKALAAKGKSMLKPPPVIFGAPRQTATDADGSWWHVPVFIQPQAVHRKELENCTVKLLSLDGRGAALDMCWRRGVRGEPVSAVTLAEGELYLVPVAARKESAGRRVAIITNQSFLAHKKVIRQLPAGISDWVLRVENADGSWESHHSYTLLVPPADRDNGHFTLEVRYAGLD